MHCRFFRGGVVCTSRRSLPKCSTPGCRNRAELTCDYPVKRAAEPKRGDARLHRFHKRIFYVWYVDGDKVGLSESPPPLRLEEALRAPQEVTLAELAERSDPTCDRPVCSKCAVQRSGLDFCRTCVRGQVDEVIP